MRLTTKGRFAVTAMLDLAVQQTQIARVTLASISERQAISLSYLEQLFAKLRRSDLVNSVRGPGGGYCLALPAQEISVAAIIQAVDEPLDATYCGGKENCLVNPNGKSGRCMTHTLWASLNQKMVQYLDSVSLQDLLNQQLSQTLSQQVSLPEKKLVVAHPLLTPQTCSL